MNNSKPLLRALCLFLCVFLLSGAVSSVSAEEDAALRLERNGHAADLTLKQLEIENGELVIAVGFENFSTWQDEQTPLLIAVYREAGVKHKMPLSAMDNLAKRGNVKNMKVTMRIPVDRTELPDELLIDIGESDPLVFWTNPDSAAAEETPAAETVGISEKYSWKDYILLADSVEIGIGKEISYPPTRAIRKLDPDAVDVDKSDDLFFAVRLVPEEGEIVTNDVMHIEDNMAFHLTGPDGEEIPLHSFLWWGFGFDMKVGPVIFDTQEGFMLFYQLPGEMTPDELSFTVSG